VRQVADDGEQGVVGHKPTAVKRHKVITGDALDLFHAIRPRASVWMEAEHEPVNQRVGDVLGILGTDLQSLNRLVHLAPNLGRRKRRAPRHFRRHIQRQFHLVFDDGAVDERHLVGRTHREDAARRFDRVRNDFR